MARRERSATLAAVALVLLALLAVLPGTPGALADPAVVDNLNGSKTATWTFDTPSNYTPSGAVQLGPSRLTLSNTSSTLGVYGAAQLLSSGSADGNLTSGNGTIRLLGHPDPVADGNFSVPGPWRYQNGSLGKVSAAWSPGVARFNHTAPPTWSVYESMDNPRPHQVVRLCLRGIA